MVKTERILITGITGKSGNYLFEILDAGSNRLKKYEFGFAVRNEHKAGKIRQSNFRCVIHTGNLDNQPFIDSLFRNKGYNTLLNIAGIEYSLPLVKEAVNNGVTRLILVHTTGIYSKNRKLAEHCRQIEEDIKLFVLGKGVSLTILRPTMVYGNL
ncbi:MAG: hypothetical protein GX851_04640, partial [Clostridiales bacterium]|nr:hypothetical protein [Clostridiales bacterium]